MLERLENLSALYANPHRFMNLAARLHVRSGWSAVGASLWLFMVAVCPMITSKGQRYALCLCMCRRRGWRFCL